MNLEKYEQAIFRNRQHAANGKVALFVRSNMKHKERTDWNGTSAELTKGLERIEIKMKQY